MPWVQLTADKISSALTPAEVELLQRLTPDEYSLVLQRALDGVTARVRAKVGSRAGNLLSADTSLIPPELEGDALWLVAEELKTGPSMGLPLSEDQRNRVKRAYDVLDAVAKGTFLVSLPAVPETATSLPAHTGSAQLLTTRTRTFGDTDARGLA